MSPDSLHSSTQPTLVETLAAWLAQASWEHDPQRNLASCTLPHKTMEHLGRAYGLSAEALAEQLTSLQKKNAVDLLEQVSQALDLGSNGLAACALFNGTLLGGMRFTVPQPLRELSAQLGTPDNEIGAWDLDGSLYGNFRNPMR